MEPNCRVSSPPSDHSHATVAVVVTILAVLAGCTAPGATTQPSTESSAPASLVPHRTGPFPVGEERVRVRVALMEKWRVANTEMDRLCVAVEMADVGLIKNRLELEEVAALFDGEMIVVDRDAAGTRGHARVEFRPKGERTYPHWDVNHWCMDLELVWARTNGSPGALVVDRYSFSNWTAK